LPEALKAGGYRTFFAGKWHLGSEEQESLPTDHGFDYNQGGYQLGGPYSGGFFSPFNNPFMEDYPEEKGMSLSMKLAKETNQFIRENKDTSFFAMLSFYAVHAPIQTTKARWQKYRDKAERQGIDSIGFEMERILPIRKYQDNPVYAGLVEQVDIAVGSVLETLDSLGLTENTVIIFTSDHGGVASGDNYATNNNPLRGGKGYQWEGGLRVPTIVNVPWLAHNGQLEDSPISGADWYPTVVELAGLPLRPEEHLDGHSLMPLLKGSQIPERPLYWHYPHYGNQGGEPHAIIRQGDWKLIHYWEDNRNELYDLARDLSEKNDVSKENMERVKTMSTQLLTWLDTAGARYARIDSTRDVAAAQMVLEKNRTVLKDRLEEQRRSMFAKYWQPNEDWWGSEISEKD
jgi:arylsulfatase A-like enzyme